jgi:hypothetical protein
MRTVDVDPVGAWFGNRYSFDEYSLRTGRRGCDYFVLIVDDVELLEEGLMYDMVAGFEFCLRDMKARRPTRD